MPELRLIRGGVDKPLLSDNAAVPEIEHISPLQVDAVALAKIDHDKAVDVEKIKADVVASQHSHWMEKHNLDAVEAQKQRDHEVVQAQKQRDHEELQRVRNHEEAQRQRDDAHRARLTWIGSGLTVVIMVAVGVTYTADHAFGKEVFTHATTLIGGILGGLGISGLGINRAIVPKALPQPQESRAQPQS